MGARDVSEAFSHAEAVLSQATQVTKRAVTFAAGRLRKMHLDTSVLRDLKHELSKFDSKRGVWK